MVSYYFRGEPPIWLTSLGLGFIVGFALMLCTGPVSMERFRTRFWESMRLFICPFMVASFSALVAGNQFVLVFSSIWQENLVAIAAIAFFLVLVLVIESFFIRGEE